ncbi:methionine adenosyltransferase 2 subunit beta-like isoform X2 [Nilaparvata lugens]|uniref:methionine adenosyltransferase 2 subunit beta-like isoform X2 n=1 Tax=Nilaparvata lugens TaxID=108931 RepID=UPI00193E7029|nr:methionine adenosyltransferase 2 subunit beta-like isoform X2 [Nilaparvata lugens]
MPQQLCRSFKYCWASGDLHKVDITNSIAVQEALSNFKPTLIIHSAAQRFPDLVDKFPNEARQLNVEASKLLATEAAKLNIPILYISTDYVFDGKSAPYSVDCKPNPVNLYGKLKLEGEEQILEVNPDALILRVPVLYGPVEKLSESAVTVLLDLLLNPAVPKSVSDYERRCPSHVDDIAHICFQLAGAKNKDTHLKGIFHWCGNEVFTKYQMVVKMSEVFGLPMDHLTADKSVTSSVTRPFDTQLDTSRLVQLGFGQHTPFTQGINQALSQWVSDRKH